MTPYDTLCENRTPYVKNVKKRDTLCEKREKVFENRTPYVKTEHPM